jgi:hypothetical protein
MTDDEERASNVQLERQQHRAPRHSVHPMVRPFHHVIDA